MNNSDSISEQDAANLSGVSVVTLKRFADMGCLSIEEASVGESFFSRAEIEQVFGLTSRSENVEDIVEQSSHDESHSTEPTTVEALSVQKLAEKVETITTAPKNFEGEISRLSSINRLQEKYIEHKELEVKNLKEERDWLRARIEKLEDKNNRDQMILVSISESNRNLIKNLEQRRSSLTLKGALQWIGLLPEPVNQEKSSDT